MKCEFYKENEKPICSLWYHGGYPTASTCEECIKNGNNNKKTADEMFAMLKINPQEIYIQHEEKPKKEKLKGLGDIVHSIAQPIAKTIDMTFGTNIQGCGGCKRRRKKLNEMLPISVE